MEKIGIDLISFYSPAHYLDLKVLATARGVDDHKFYKGLGQEKMAILPPDEDIVTMGAQAAKVILEQSSPDEIDLVLFATESGVDQSKSGGIPIHRLLNLSPRCRVIELKQACYSATAGIQMAMGLLTSKRAKRVLLIASDVAKYGLNTPGESSQGAGAVAMILSHSPRILALSSHSGFYTEDVHDFWRPNYQDIPVVNGKYSIELYLRCLEKTWAQYHQLSQHSFSDHAYICYHAAIPRLVEKAHKYLAKLTHNLDKVDPIGAVEASLIYGRSVGNCYAASLYLSFISILDHSKEDLSHKRIGFYSYGSGCTAEFFSGIVQPGYQNVLATHVHQELLHNRNALTQQEYESFFNFTYPTDGTSVTLPIYKKHQGFRLSGFSNHQRLYETVAP